MTTEITSSKIIFSIELLQGLNMEETLFAELYFLECEQNFCGEIISCDDTFLVYFHNSHSKNTLRSRYTDCSYITGMAKLRPAGRMRPFNFFLRPVDLLLLFKNLSNRHLKASENDKLEEKNAKKFCFAKIVIIKSVYSNSAALNEN
jgi:hypothetical protein